jgi:hypothetical protein
MRNFLLTRAALIWCSLVLVAASNPEGIAFLKENAQKDGVVVLPSGTHICMLPSSVITSNLARPPAYVSYASIRQHTSAYVSIR